MKENIIIIKNKEILKEISKINNKYNTYVKTLLNEKYLKVGEEILELQQKIQEDYLFFKDAKNMKITSYKVYCDKKFQSEINENLLKKKQIEQNIWNKAKEVCMKAIDDLEIIK